MSTETVTFTNASAQQVIEKDLLKRRSIALIQAQT